MIGKHFPYFAGQPSSAAKSTAPPWQTRCEYSRHIPAESRAGCTSPALSHSLIPPLKPGAGGRTLEGPCSWPFPAQLHKVNETCRGISAGDRATRALQSITSGVQRRLPPPFAFASHSLVWSRISDSPLQSLNKDWGRGIKGRGDLKMKSSYFLISYLKFIASFCPLNKQLFCPLQLQHTKLTATCNVKFTLVPFIRISFHIAL